MRTRAQDGGRVHAIVSAAVLIAMAVALTGCRTSVWATGLNSSGQVGDGTTTERQVLTGIDTDVEHAQWKQVSAGNNHTVAIMTDGELWAWGANTVGQVGDGTIVNRSAPVSISGVLTWSAVTAGGDHSLALRSDGTLWAWGDNALGQLGDGTTTNRLAPVQVGAGISWKAVDTGASHTLAVSTAGNLYAWGKNNTGQLGDNTLVNRLVPTKIGTSTAWASVAAGGQHSLAIQSDNSLWGWGDNSSGQVGDGTTVNRKVPVHLGASTWIQIAAGTGHSLAIRSDGTLWSWGYNGHGQIGDNTIISRATPFQIGNGYGNNLGWTTIAAGRDFSIATQVYTSTVTGPPTEVRSSFAWGDNTNGNLGTGDTFDVLHPSEVLTNVGASRSFVNPTAGDHHTLALQPDGTLWAWGSNLYGQLGDGTTTQQVRPVGVLPVHDWAVISAGRAHTLAVRKDGTLWAWGENTHGQVGDGTTTNRPSPVQIGTNTTWKTVSAGGSHSMAIRTDGTLWAWGSNSSGQLGIGGNVDLLQPTASLFVGEWLSVSAGESSSSGMFYGSLGFATGTVAVTWGDNSSGQLGIGTTTNASTFIYHLPSGAVDTNPDHNIGFSSIAMGGSHTLAIDTDGGLWSWGYNGTGAVGDGTTANALLPKRIGTATDWKQVEAGSYHSVAIKNDGSVWTWGYNGFGELGDGTTTQRLTPTQVPLSPGYGMKAVSAGLFSTAAIGTDGALYTWGNNSAGQLGDGTTTNRSVPTRIGSETKWLAISAGGSTLMALHDG